MWFTDVRVVSIYSIPAAQHAASSLDIWINLLQEANSSPAAIWRHTAVRAPVLGLATGFLCVREPLWIELLTNLSTWSGNIQQLHGTFHLQRMQFDDKQYEIKSQTVLNQAGEIKRILFYWVARSFSVLGRTLCSTQNAPGCVKFSLTSAFLNFGRTDLNPPLETAFHL